MTDCMRACLDERQIDGETVACGYCIVCDPDAWVRRDAPSLRDRVFAMAADARLAAKAEGWRPHPEDRDLYLRGIHRIRLTEIDPRRWVWSDVA